MFVCVLFGWCLADRQAPLSSTDRESTIACVRVYLAFGIGIVVSDSASKRVCERERERFGVPVCLCVCVYASACAHICAGASVCARTRMRIFLCVFDLYVLEFSCSRT